MTAAYGGPLKFRRYGRRGSSTYTVVAPWAILGTVSLAEKGWEAVTIEGEQVLNNDLLPRHFSTRRAAAASLDGGF